MLFLQNQSNAVWPLRNLFFYMYTNADLKICHYIRLHRKKNMLRFHIETHFTFRDMRT